MSGVKVNLANQHHQFGERNGKNYIVARERRARTTKSSTSGVPVGGEDSYPLRGSYADRTHHAKRHVPVYSA